jgi:AcrR family transcriptional regulator
MPKIVDHDVRRKELGEAAWRIIRREGLDAVTVRNVAKEAGVSLGALRHYFTSQSDLLAFSMRMISDRVKERIANIKLSGDIRADCETLIEELLPMDADRRNESEIWLAFTGRRLVDPKLAELNAQVYDELYSLFLKLVRAIVRYREAVAGAPCGLDTELEARRLNALVDGLVVHAVSRPDVMTPGMIRSIVRRHLDGLLPEAEEGE